MAIKKQFSIILSRQDSETDIVIEVVNLGYTYTCGFFRSLD